MSKIKDEMERIRELEFEQYVSFMEWVCDQQQDVSEDDTNEEDEDSQKEPSTTGTSIVHKNTLNPVNNIDFNPQIGA